MRRRFDTAYIHSELERIGEHLDNPLDGFLIGGGAMTFRDLKDATKDIDLIVSSGFHFGHLQGTLRSLGYEEVQAPTTAYEELGAQTILENEDGCRVDLFNQQVVDKLILSDGIRERAEHYLGAGDFTVQLVSPEDIFLFKAVAGRTDDVDDMFSLAQTGLDFAIVERELRQQTELLGQEMFVTYVNETLGELADRHNLRTALDDPVEEITNRVYEELAVLNSIDESERIDDLQDAVEFEHGEFEDVVDRLIEKDVIEVVDGQVRQQSNSV